MIVQKETKNFLPNIRIITFLFYFSSKIYNFEFQPESFHFDVSFDLFFFFLRILRKIISAYDILSRLSWVSDDCWLLIRLRLKILPNLLECRINLPATQLIESVHVKNVRINFNLLVLITEMNTKFIKAFGSHDKTKIFTYFFFSL